MLSSSSSFSYRYLSFFFFFFSNAAPLFMNTGLAEIALPIDFRLKNIQRTEEARSEIKHKRDGVFHRRDRPRGLSKITLKKKLRLKSWHANFNQEMAPVLIEAPD